MAAKPRFDGEKQALEGRVEYVRGVTYKAAVDLRQELNDDSYILLRANNIQDGALSFDDVQYVDRSKVKPSQLLRKGDILVCASSGSKGLVGKSALVKKDMPVTFGAFCCVLRPKDGESEYLSHYFQSRQYRSAIEDACSGSNINNLKASNFKALIVPRYSVGDMQAIVDVLTALNDQKTMAGKQSKELDTLVKSRFVEMFGCYNNEFKTTLQNVSEFVTVGIANAATHAYVDSGVVMLRNLNVRENRLEDSDPVYIDPEFAAKYKKKRLKAGDILVTRTGYPGIACVVPKKYEGCQTFTTLIVRLKDDSPVTAEYVSQLINSPIGKEFVERSKAGSSQQNFGATSLKLMPIGIPPLALQQEFADFAAQVDKSRFIVQQQIEKLQTLYDSLAQEYFS